MRKIFLLLVTFVLLLVIPSCGVSSKNEVDFSTYRNELMNAYNNCLLNDYKNNDFNFSYKNLYKYEEIDENDQKNIMENNVYLDLHYDHDKEMIKKVMSSIKEGEEDFFIYDYQRSLYYFDTKDQTYYLKSNGGNPTTTRKELVDFEISLPNDNFASVMAVLLRVDTIGKFYIDGNVFTNIYEDVIKIKAVFTEKSVKIEYYSVIKSDKSTIIREIECEINLVNVRIIDLS